MFFKVTILGREWIKFKRLRLDDLGANLKLSVRPLDD